MVERDGMLSQGPALPWKQDASTRREKLFKYSAQQGLETLLEVWIEYFCVWSVEIRLTSHCEVYMGTGASKLVRRKA
jgi:hypothetical protein